ncbi:MAG: hypothetical protein Q8L01_02825, partial [Candidatus Woesebacteria bacterium]|nr:hypothetical protein [Candidatus Woesebacteria bacterium]
LTHRELMPAPTLLYLFHNTIFAEEDCNSKGNFRQYNRREKDVEWPDKPSDNVGDNTCIPNDLISITDNALKYCKAAIDGHEERSKIVLKKVFFRDHALRRLRERFPNQLSGHTDLKRIEKIARTLICQSTEERIHDAVRLKRLLNNRCKEVRYYRFGEIRFVVDAQEENGVHDVITVERHVQYIDYK